MADASDYLVLDATPGAPQDMPYPHYSAASVDNSVETVHNLGISPGKLVLGIPFGARVWGPGWDGTPPLTAREVSAITARFTLRERYDPAAKSTYLDFTIRPGEVFYAAGRRMYPGNYTMNGSCWACAASTAWRAPRCWVRPCPPRICGITTPCGWAPVISKM